MLLRGLKLILKFIVAIAALFGLMFCIYFGWAWWEMKQLKSFCSEVREGVPISSLPPLAEKYGFSPRWVKSGITETGKKNQITFVPAASTFGEIACAIRYDESGVISANIGP